MAATKHILSFFTYMQVLMSLAMIGLGIYMLVSNYIIAVAAAVVLLCLGIALFVIGLFGIIGARKKKKFCLCLYQIGIVPLALASLGLGIGSAVYSNNLF
jgi:uncharacterized membrane protein HdeD (DUF308 family)